MKPERFPGPIIPFSKEIVYLCGYRLRGSWKSGGFSFSGEGDD